MARSALFQQSSEKAQSGPKLMREQLRAVRSPGNYARPICCSLQTRGDSSRLPLLLRLLFPKSLTVEKETRRSTL
ncbi:hypothetical protein NDU88_002652 [Pleurodeles waltl]|uniref:Uncharacterized protein n=1 Tax=Pleurodeles waltl TaxID=8319 RepID=A0AAV7SCA8_PLEWA|nr:hypothetical protein NDU88_002652 [Pleurodeles waltl]